MKRLARKTSNSSTLITEMSREMYDEYAKNMFTALKKFGSSRKTKATHKLIDKKMPAPAIFVGTTSDALVNANAKGPMLYQIALNMYQFDDTMGGDSAVSTSVDLARINKQIQKEETFVNDARLKSIEKLKENEAKTEEKLLKSYDYVRMVDGVYFGFLLHLSKLAIVEDSAGRGKIITTAADILAGILKKIYTKVNPGKIGTEEHQLLEAIAIYFIRVYYEGMTSQYALNSMKKGFSDEIIETIKRTKVTRITEFNQISDILRGTELMSIPASTFNSVMENMFGKLGYNEYITQSLVDFVAFFANASTPSSLFKDFAPIDQELYERLEELILNEQKKVQFKERTLS